MNLIDTPLRIEGPIDTVLALLDAQTGVVEGDNFDFGGERWIVAQQEVARKHNGPTEVRIEFAKAHA